MYIILACLKLILPQFCRTICCFGKYFLLESGKLIGATGPSISGSIHRINRCNYWFDQFYIHYNFVENNGIIILKNYHS